MKKTLFITGASGFVGTNFLRRINIDQYNHIYCVGRTKNNIITRLGKNNNFTFIKADIFDSHLYKQYLYEADIVIHLAAITGKAKPMEYFDVNFDGTRFLLQQCNALQTKQFIFISSIAVTFQNIKNYYYAQSKLKAEEFVKNSGLQYTIIRPTIVVGQNSPIIGSLSKLAKMPIVPIFGDGLTKIQPIYVEDLVECIMYVVNNRTFLNETIDLGGPEQITIESFIKIIHNLLKKNKFRSIYLPIRLLISILNVLEKHFLSFLPFTAGQLSSFSNDGISEKSLFLENRSLKLKGINEMLELSISTEVEESGSFQDLEKECSMFTNYLINYEPDNYIQKKYQQGQRAIENYKGAAFFDSLLLKVALKSLFLTKLVDIYTSIFYRKALIRKKMLFLLAILECRTSTYIQIDSANESSSFLLYLKLGYKAFVFLLWLVLSIIVFGPIHAVSYLHLKLIKHF